MGVFRQPQHNPLSPRRVLGMKRKYILAALCAIFLTIGCSTISSVRYDYDTEADFRNLKTYDWLEEYTEMSAIDAKRIKNAIDAELTARGYSQSLDDPDFMIAFHGTSEEKVNVVDHGYRYCPYGRYCYGYWGWGSTPTTYTYEEGTLIIDFIDSESLQMVWRGEAKGVLDPNLSPERLDQVTNEAVQRILQNFPPPAK
jgi:hypothetical protein